MAKSVTKTPVLPSSLARSRRWLIFWIAFIGAPILGLLSASLQIGPGFFLFPLLGAIVAGFALAGLLNHEPGMVVIVGFLLSFGILIVYAGIFFVGCLVTFKM